MKKITTFNKLLFLFLVFIGVMIFARIQYSGNTRYLFLTWNIFLGWLPYMLSGYLKDYQNKAPYKKLILFSTWLVFFPNALYIITDLIHLQHTSNVPTWYDAILLFASSFAGMMMAFISLKRVEIFLGNIFSKKVVLIFVPVILFLGAFGVYLGRFQRWNSWNVINDPLALGLDIFNKVLFPHDNLKTWGITLILTALYSMLYFFIKIFPQAFPGNNPANANERPFKNDRFE